MPNAWKRFNRALRSLAQSVLGAALAAGFGHAHAQSWPSKPVRVIVSISAGSGTDLVARMFADSASKTFGRPLFVENIVGASGMIAAQAAARAAADGYTLYVATSSVLASNPYMFKSVPYNAFRDFAAIAMLFDSGPFVISVTPEFPARTLADLIAVAKAKPGNLSYAVDASSGYLIITGELLSRRSGTNMVQVGYKTGAQVLQDTASGLTQFMISSITAASGFVKAGKLRMIAVTSERRFPGLGDLPTVSETIPGFRMDGWNALVVPTGTPQEIIRRLNREAEAFVTRPEVLQRLLQFGLAISGPKTPETTAEFIRSEQDYWAQVMKELNFQPR